MRRRGAPRRTVGRRLKRDGGLSLLRLRRLADQFQQSLFFLPAIFVVGSVVLAFGAVRLDRTLGPGDLPDFFSTTVDNARSILSTVAGGTISSASVVFSLTLIAVQLASSQFSPRALRGFLGDRFQQIVMGIVVGTFTYSLVVLRVVQQPRDTSTSDPFLPRLSVLLAVIFAVASLLAVLGSIDHTAKSLRVGSLLDRIADDTIATIEARLVRADDDDQRALILDAPGIVPASPRPRPHLERRADHEPPEDALVVRATRPGWVTQLSVEAIFECLPEGSTVLLRTAVGTYLVPGVPIASVWSSSELDTDHVRDTIEDAIEVRSGRTHQQDVSFGLLQLADIAMRALSPGVNDPNTANEAIVRIGVVLASLLQHDLTTSEVRSGSSTIALARAVGPHDYVDAAIEPIRRYAKEEPNVLQVLVRTLAGVRDAVAAEADHEVSTIALDAQIELVTRALDELGSAEARDEVREALEEFAEG